MNKLFHILIFALFAFDAQAFKQHVSISVVCRADTVPMFVVNSKRFRSIKIVEVRDEHENIVWLSLLPDTRKNRKGFLSVSFGRTKDRADILELPRDLLMEGKIYRVNLSVPGGGGYAWFQMDKVKGRPCHALND